MKRYRRKLRDSLDTSSSSLVETMDYQFADTPIQDVRAHPDQKAQNSMWLYVPSPNFNIQAAQFVMSAWVYTGISRFAEKSARASAMVFKRNDEIERFEDHPLVRLLGEYGIPNDSQDSYEFLEEHFINLGLYGNSLWYWVARTGGRADEVHILDPRRVQIEPGKTRRYGKYIYRASDGQDIPLDPLQITHFKRHNPHNAYWGMSALQAVQIEIQSDRHMAIWNDQFFGEDVGIPAGIIVLPPDTPDADMDRIEIEANARYSARRRTAVMRGTVGGQVYHPAGALHKDLDFKEGRLISRQAIYEVLDLPLGLLSEASTEAHARVAERRFYDAVDTRLERTGRKLTADALPLWDNAKGYVVRFVEDRRDVADWQQKKMKVEAMLLTHDEDEVRKDVYGAKPRPKERTKDNGNKIRDRGQNQSTAETGGRPTNTGQSSAK